MGESELQPRRSSRPVVSAMAGSFVAWRYAFSSLITTTTTTITIATSSSNNNYNININNYK